MHEPHREQSTTRRAVTAFAAAFLLAPLAVGAGARKTDPILRKASGVTEEDVKRASAVKSLTLFDCYALAVYRTERLAIEGEGAIQADARKLAAISMWLPKIYARGQVLWPKANYSSQSPKDTISLYARQNIFSGLSEYGQIRSSFKEAKAREYRVRYAAGELLVDVASSYYTVLRIEHSLRINGQILASYRETLAELRRRAAIGRSRQSEVLRTEAQIFKLEADVTSLKKALDQARLALSTLAGLGDSFALAEPAPPPDRPFDPANAVLIADSRWDVKAAAEAVKASNAGLTAAWGGFLPTAYLEGTWFLYQQKIKQPKSTTINTSSFTTSKKRDYYLSLGVEVPIFDGLATPARIKEASSLKRQAELALQNTKRLAVKDIIDAYQAWESSGKEVAAYKKALTSAEQSYRIVAEEYRMRLVTLLDLISSLMSLQTARNDYEGALLQHHLDRIRLGAALNEFTGEDISRLRDMK